MGMSLIDALIYARDHGNIVFQHGRIEYNVHDNGWYIEQHNDKLYLEDRLHFHEEEYAFPIPCWYLYDTTYIYIEEVDQIANGDLRVYGEEPDGTRRHHHIPTESFHKKNVINAPNHLSFLRQGRHPNQIKASDIVRLGFHVDEVASIVWPSFAKAPEVHLKNVSNPVNLFVDQLFMITPVEKRTDLSKREG